MSDVTLSDAQWDAVKRIKAWYQGGSSTPQVFYLAGFAGTGKSTVYKTVREELQGCGAKKAITCAFTGKAANVLRRKGTDDAMTLHAAMYTPVEDEETGKVEFKLNITSAPAADADLIGVDECSMVGPDLGEDLLSFGKKVLVMGDPGQLPPVNGQGFFTAREPDVFLSEIHRQAAGSPILRLATLARQGKRLPVGRVGDVEVAALTKETQPLVYREETQAICGTHRVRWAYSQRIRRMRGFEGPIPTKGERVLCMRNNRDLGIFNGGQGVVLSEPQHGRDGHLRMNIDMDDLATPLKKVAVHPHHFNKHFRPDEARPRIGKDVEEFDWGLLLTCHKAQGSSWPHVTVVDDSGCFREDRWKWLYTAVTRAETGLTVLLRE